MLTSSSIAFVATMTSTRRYHLPITTTNLMRKLLAKNPLRRLGSGPADAADVMAHPYFRGVSWSKLEAGRARAPWTPVLRSGYDTSNFDREFTDAPPRLTPPSPRLGPVEQASFEGFSYCDDATNWSLRRETTL